MRILQPLRYAPVALLWSGLSLSALGDQLYAVALTWIAVQVVATNAGYLSALQAFVVLLAVLGVGRWADRWDHRRSMIGADLARAGVLCVVVLVWLATGGPSAAQLVLAIVVLAIGQAVFQPALQAALPTLVSDRRLLPAANGLLDATSRSARLLGPGLVALLAGVVPLVHFLTLDAISFLASAAAIALIARLLPSQPACYPAERETIWHGIVRGCRAMAAHPLLRYILATCGLLNGGWYAVYYLCLPLTIARYGVGETHAGNLSAYGLVLSAYGCTNLAANVCLAGRPLPVRPQFLIFGGVLLQGSGLILLGLSAPVAIGVDSGRTDRFGCTGRGGRADAGHPDSRAAPDAPATRRHFSRRSCLHGDGQHRHAAGNAVSTDADRGDRTDCRYRRLWRGRDHRWRDRSAPAWRLD